MEAEGAAEQPLALPGACTSAGTAVVVYSSWTLETVRGSYLRLLTHG